MKLVSIIFHADGNASLGFETREIIFWVFCSTKAAKKVLKHADPDFVRFSEKFTSLKSLSYHLNSAPRHANV